MKLDRVAFLAFLTVFLSTVAVASQFGSRKAYPVKGSPAQIAAGDFNGDGKLDLAVATNPLANSEIDILLGDGDGSFHQGPLIALGQFARGIAAADMNGDGNLDLVVAHASKLAVLLGTGNGTFQQASSYDVVITTAVLVADLNHDGKIDVLGLNNSASVVNLFLGNGDGTLSALPPIAAGSFPNSMIAADFNGDGNLDLLVTNSVGFSASVLLGNGDGSFQEGQNYNAGHLPSFATLGDFNQDGKTDVAVSNSGPAQVAVLLGHGDGSFQPPVKSNVTSCCGILGLAVADFDNDGRADVISINSQGKVDLLLGLGNGAFTDVSQTAATKATPGPVISVDLNGDGLVDIVVGDTINNQLVVLLNTGQ